MYLVAQRCGCSFFACALSLVRSLAALEDIAPKQEAVTSANHNFPDPRHPRFLRHPDGITRPIVDGEMTKSVDPRSWIRQIVTLEQMLADRNCTQIKTVATGTDLFHLCTASDSRNESVSVYITEENKVGVKSIRRLKEDCTRSKCKTIILLCPAGLTPFAVKELQVSEEDPTARFEIFRKSELAFNVIRHHLVPPHRVLNLQEKKKLLSDLGTKLGNLPKLKETDPVAKYLGLSAGTVVEIFRSLGSLETESFYRAVVQ